MIPKFKRGVSVVRARNSTLPTRCPSPGHTITGPSLMEVVCHGNSTGAIRAAAVECYLMPVRDEAGLPLDLQDQILHELLVELDDGAALLAAGMVVYALGRQLVARVTLAEIIL